MNPAHDATLNSSTLSQSITTAVARGYTANFKIISKGLTEDDERSIYSPEEVKISNFYRFEGYNNPDDSSIIYLIETKDGRKGTLIDAYGAYADAVISKFITQVEDIQKIKPVS